MKKLKILDWYVHQGHQYEFFKTGHDFYLTSVNGGVPDWNSNHRPKNKNLKFTREAHVKGKKFDIVMIRSPINIKRYTPFIKKGAVPIAVVQTTSPFFVPSSVKHIIWNSAYAMENHKNFYRNKIHHYIPHGYDPNEFFNLNLNKNGKVLTVANVFKGRSKIMGFPMWKKMSNIYSCDIFGHGNSDIDKSIRTAKSLDELVRIYNSYSVYFNPTVESAMPRSRAEAAMCGMPIVTTNNFDISRYFYHNKNAILSNNFLELKEGIKRLLDSKDMQKEYGERAREVAIKHFHIKNYLDKWNRVFERA